MTDDERHDIPAHLIPDDREAVLTENDEEAELNQELETERWIYTEEPSDGRCPYCGKEYRRVRNASQVEDARKGVCPYPVEEYKDFITEFIHGQERSRTPGWENGEPAMVETLRVTSYCSPEYEETHIGGGLHTRKKWDLTNV